VTIFDQSDPSAEEKFGGVEVLFAGCGAVFELTKVV